MELRKMDTDQTAIQTSPLHELNQKEQKQAFSIIDENGVEKPVKESMILMALQSAEYYCMGF